MFFGFLARYVGVFNVVSEYLEGYIMNVSLHHPDDLYSKERVHLMVLRMRTLLDCFCSFSNVVRSSCLKSFLYAI